MDRSLQFLCKKRLFQNKLSTQCQNYQKNAYKLDTLEMPFIMHINLKNEQKNGLKNQKPLTTG